MSDLPDVQPYLKSICDRYQQWWQLYTPTDASGKRQPTNKLQSPFDFGLIVQTVKKESREPEKEEKVERFPVLKGVRKYAKNHVLLVGRPGSGKSTALARLLLDEATQQTSIPVLVELRYWQGSIVDLICEAFARHELSLTAQELEPVLSRLAQGATPKEMLFLFDGVNELPSEEARSQLSAFRRNHPKLPMIFTTRDLSLGGDLGIEKKLEMQPLTETQMQAFIRSYVPEQAERMLRQLNDLLREFGQTPLLLWMLCSLFQQTGQIPENLGLVFREFTQGYERYLKEDVRIESDRAWWKPVLQQLAWVMMQGEKPTELRVAIGKEEAVRAIAQFLDGKVPYAEDFARKCLRDLQKHHLIQAGTNNEELEFRHQLIQEYYAAEALLEQLPKLDDEQLKQEYLNYLKWTEPVALMLALVDEAQAIRVVTLALRVDLQLGARLAGEVKTVLAKTTLQLIKKLSVSKSIYILLLGKTHSDKTTDVLKKALKNPNLVRVAITALGELSSPKALDILFQAVQHNTVQDNRCETIFEIFGRVADQSASSYLQQIVRCYNNSPFVRAIAAKELRNFSSDDVIQTLYEAALDEDDYVRQKASFALETIGSQRANAAREKSARIVQGDELYDALVTMISKMAVNHKMVTSTISEEAGKDSIQSIPTAIASLQWYLKQCNVDLKPDFNIELEAYKTDDLLYFLKQLLDHPDADLRLRVIYALGEVDDPQAVSLLVQALADSNFDNRANAAGTLGQIANPSAIPPLIRAFNQEENIPASGSYVRLCIVEALGCIRSSEALPFLEQLMNNDEADLFNVVLEAIGNINNPQSIQFLYKQLCSDKVENVSDWMKTICEIQSSCKYYNYEIFQDYLEAQKPDRQTSQNSDRSPTTTNHFPNVTELKIFENVDRYHEAPPPPKDPPS